MKGQRATQLSALRADIDRLTREAAALADNFDVETRLAREEAVGAELLAGRDLVAHLGMLWDTAEQLGDLYLRQARLLVEDHTTTLLELLDGKARRSPAMVFDAHVQRRLAHLGEGVEHGVEIVSTQSAQACEALVRLWTPFLAVIRQDWALRRGDGPRSTHPVRG